MKKLSYLSLLLLLVITTACHHHQQDTQKNSTALLPTCEAVYTGTLPCADCPGIEARLTLKGDSTFIYENTYIDRENGHFTYTGKYTIKDNILTIQEENTPRYFLVGDRTLTLLDHELKPAQGVLAPYYTLKKQE